jgi:hypothetical protein
MGGWVHWSQIHAGKTNIYVMVCAQCLAEAEGCCQIFIQLTLAPNLARRVCDMITGRRRPSPSEHIF